jgi:hypothetical protein
VAEGFGVKRLPVMYNDFVLIGPKGDPAGVRGKDITAALKKLAGGNGQLHLARRQERHPRRRTALLEGRRRRPGRRQAGRLQGMRLRHGPGAEHGFVNQRLCAGRPRHLAQLQEPRRTGHPGRRRQAPVQPVRRDGGQPGRTRMSRRTWPRPLPTGWCRRPARPRSPATRSAASSCSSPTPGHQQAAHVAASLPAALARSASAARPRPACRHPGWRPPRRRTARQIWGIGGRHTRCGLPREEPASGA